jgi:hypothetical protein
VSVCAGTGTNAAGCDTANTQAEFLVVHMPAATQSASLPPINLLAPVDSNFRGLEIGGPSPKVALFARNGALMRGVGNFSTQQAGTIQFLIAGLAAGKYDVWKNGSQLLQQVQVGNNDNSLYFESTSGSFSIVFQGAQLPLPIGGARVHPAYTGIYYQFDWTATGGKPPYSWSVVAGALPAGMHLTADGTIWGTALSAGLSNYTLQVTDAEGARATISSTLPVLRR